MCAVIKYKKMWVVNIEYNIIIRLRAGIVYTGYKVNTFKYGRYFFIFHVLKFVEMAYPMRF